LHHAAAFFFELRHFHSAAAFFIVLCGVGALCQAFECSLSSREKKKKSTAATVVLWLRFDATCPAGIVNLATKGKSPLTPHQKKEKQQQQSTCGVVEVFYCGSSSVPPQKKKDATINLRHGGSAAVMAMPCGSSKRQCQELP